MGGLEVDSQAQDRADYADLAADHRIPTLQGQLLEDGIRASSRKICSVLGYNQSNLYYSA
jgi:hypothetical protein